MRSLSFALPALLALACGNGSMSNDAPGGSGGTETAAGGSAATDEAGALGGTGGAVPAGGMASGGAAASGAASGGAAAGGAASGGAAVGGAASGGAAAGNASSAGSSGLGGAAMGTAGTGGANTGASPGMEWVPSWATTIQNTEPSNLPPALGNNTLRQFVWPTLAGERIRIQLSNERGESPVDIQKVHIARAKTQADPANSNGSIDTATEAAFTFNGTARATIPAGETVWSDALDFSLPELELTAVTMQFGNVVPSAITGHPGARTTSYVANGDAVSQEALSGAQTRDRWYFINAIEVMAPGDSYAIAVLGDSITDGYGVLNRFARWPDFMTLAIKGDPQIAKNRSVLNFGMGANKLTVSGEHQDAGVVRFERDVLKRDKIKWLIVLEGINDIVEGNVPAQPIIEAYQQIILKSHENGILVYGGTITPHGEAGVRAQVNDWIRTSGAFDEVIDFDAVLRDPNNANRLAAMFNNDGLHPNLAGYEAMGRAVDLSLFKQVLGDE